MPLAYALLVMVALVFGAALATARIGNRPLQRPEVRQPTGGFGGGVRR